MRIDAFEDESAVDFVAYLDGCLDDQCFYADEEAGCVKSYVLDPQGNYQVAADGEFVSRTRYGRVQILPGRLDTASAHL